jgi:hypothetical protein
MGAGFRTLGASSQSYGFKPFHIAFCGGPSNRTARLILFVVTALVLAIAMANAANLLLAQQPGAALGFSFLPYK